MLLVLGGCKTPNLILSDDLKTDTSVMEAKGRQGWQFNQVIKFDKYTTSKIKRGWTKGYQIQFILRFEKAEQKLSFTQYTPDSLEKAEVLAIGKFQNTELDLLKGFLSYSVKYVNSFAGTVLPAKKDYQNWEFIIHNPESSLPDDADCGLAKDGNGSEILIRGVKKLEGQANWVQLDNFGFEFIQNGKSIGAVSTVNNGRIWIKNSLSPELKLVIASISSSLLVRHSMKDSFSNNK